MAGHWTVYRSIGISPANNSEVKFKQLTKMKLLNILAFCTYIQNVQMQYFRTMQVFWPINYYYYNYYSDYPQQTEQFQVSFLIDSRFVCQELIELSRFCEGIS